VLVATLIVRGRQQAAAQSHTRVKNPRLQGNGRRRLSPSVRCIDAERFGLVTRYVGEIGLDVTPECKGFWEDQNAVFEHVLQMCARAGGRILTTRPPS
jgi:hypothetical protein